jgi:hypothetical protein
MTNRLMISVAAAALLAGAGFANAQGTGTSREAPSAEHAVPSSATPMNRNDIPDRGANRSGEKMQPQGGKNQRAQDNMKANPRGEKSAEEKDMKRDQSKDKSAQTEERGSKNMKAEGREDHKDMKAEGREDRNGNMKAEERGERNGNMKAEGREDRNGNMKAESKGSMENRSQTVGQAGAGAKLSSEQRTKITTVIRGEHVAPVNNVNFYPDWRGYEFILVRNQIVVVDPQTFEIVAVLDA